MKRGLAAGMIAAAVVWLWALRPVARAVRVECLDMGPGQCWIVRGPGGSRVVVNCGRLNSGSADASSWAAASGALVRSGANSIDCLIATRSDSGVCSGMKALAGQFQVRQALAAAGALDGLRRDMPELGWQAVRPGGSVVTRDGLALSLIGHGDAVEAILIEQEPTSIALIDRLSPWTVRQLTAAAPAALVFGHTASLSEASALGGLQADAAVLHTGRGRSEWADYGLLRTLRDRCQRVWQTGQNGGVTLQADGRTIRALVTRARG